MVIIMAMNTVKRLAADILSVGVSRIAIDPQQIKKAAEALTREDVRGLIKDGIVYAKPVVGNRKLPPRARFRKRSYGKRKGERFSRKAAKPAWMEKIRSQRAFLKQLVADGSIEKKNKRALYLKIKGNAFKGKKQILTYLKDNKLLVKEPVQKKVSGKQKR